MLVFVLTFVESYDFAAKIRLFFIIVYFFGFLMGLEPRTSGFWVLFGRIRRMRPSVENK